MRIKFLVVGLLLAMGIAVAMDQRDGFEAPIASWLYPGLLESLTSVTGVRIARAGQGVELVYEDGQWVVAQRFNYPLNQKQLSRLLNQLGDARLVEKKTALPKHHGRLGLLSGLKDPAPMITVQRDPALAPVLIGQQASARQATFVRFQADDQVWLIDQALDVSAAPADWLDPSLLNLTDAMIEQIDIDSPVDSGYRVTRDDGGNWVLATRPEGRSLRYETALTPLTTTVGQLQLMDVAEHDPARWAAGAATAVYHLTSDDRLVLKTVLATGEYWLRILIETDEADETDETDEAGGADSALQPGLDQILSPSREALNRFDFKIAKRNFDDLNRSLESFLKPKAAEGIDD